MASSLPDASLTLAEANRLTAAALDAAGALGFAATAAVVDAGGHLVAFRRADHALFVTAAIAQRKAWTAAGSGMATELWNLLAATPEVHPILHAPGLMAVAGGLPLTKGTRVVGGIGVSGGTAEQDGEAARAAVAASPLLCRTE